jgi:hypothetical protein
VFLNFRQNFRKNTAEQMLLLMQSSPNFSALSMGELSLITLKSDLKVVVVAGEADVAAPVLRQR